MERIDGLKYRKLKILNKEKFEGDQWKTWIAEANGISEKCNNANNIFITHNTALFVLITFSLHYKSISLLQ